MALVATSRAKPVIKLPLSKKNEKGKQAVSVPQAYPKQVPESARFRPKPPDFSLYPENKRPSAFEGPCTPAEALSKYKHFFTEKEEFEVGHFPMVYYIRQGPPLIKKVSHVSSNGFVFKEDDHIAYRYQQQSILGDGSSGCVIKCLDHKTGENVAIKLIQDSKKYHEQIILERDLLKLLQTDSGPESHHIIKYKESFFFRDQLCIVMELASINVYSVLCTIPFKRMPLQTIQMIARQTAESLAFVHSKNIIHSDIKPENILFMNRRRNSIKLIDFGCSCSAGNTIYTYIQSRFYRAPEVVLENPYSIEIDIWSYGCLLCELNTGKALFEACNEEELIEMIISLIGPPKPSLVKDAPRAKYYFDPEGNPLPKVLNDRTTIQKETHINDLSLLSLISGCLKWDPNERLTADQILKHSYFKHSPNNAPSGYMRT